MDELVTVKEEQKNTVKITKCLNCETEFEGNFCPHCGQKADTGRFTVRFIFQNFILGILSNDGGVWFTLKNLFTRPGQMMIDIINGKRKSYFSPFPMLFLTLSLYVVIFAFTGSKDDDFNVSNLEKVEATVENQENTDYNILRDKVISYVIVFNNLYKNHYATVMVLTIPLYLFASRISYGRNNRKKYNWGEYCIPVVYATILVFLYRCLLSIIFAISDKLYDFLDNLVWVVFWAAFTACFKKMLGFSIVKTVWRTVLMCVVYYAVIILMIVVVGSIFVLINYDALKSL
ncbi:MAG: DUF3667 domain-containing protein [Bacteroidales bacterium]|nr:DUF3667 domain-containing protein [Bacteroidales bacterium]